MSFENNENKIIRKIVVQCAKRKITAPTLFFDNAAVKFHSKTDISQNIFTPWSTVPETSQTWIDAVREYNESFLLPANTSIHNASELTNAADLYYHHAYRDLSKRFGYKSIFVLSAGWGLVQGDTKIPTYDITFSTANKDCRIKPSERVKYDSILLDAGTCDELHLFITQEYLEYWNLFFSKRFQSAKKVILHWRKGQKPPPFGEYSIIEHDCGKRRTTWQYTAIRQFLERD